MNFKFNLYAVALFAGTISGCVNTFTQSEYTVEQTEAPEIRTELGDQILAESAFNDRVLQDSNSSLENVTADLNLDDETEPKRKLTAGETAMLADPTITVTAVDLSKDNASAEIKTTNDSKKINENSSSDAVTNKTSILESKNAYIRWRDEAPNTENTEGKTNVSAIDENENKALEESSEKQSEDKPLYLDEKLNQKSGAADTDIKDNPENEVVLTDDLNTSNSQQETVVSAAQSDPAESSESKFDSASPTTDSIDTATAWYKKEYGALASPINELDRNLQRLFLQEKYSYCKKVTFMSFDTKCKSSEQNKFVGFKSVYSRNKGADIRYSYQFTNYIPGIRVDYSVMKVDKELYKDEPVVVLSKTFTIDILNTKHSFEELVSIEPF